MNRKRIVRAVLGLSGVVIFAIVLYLGGTESLSRVVHGDPVYLLATLLAIGAVTLVGALRWRLLVSALTRQPTLPMRQVYHYNIIGRLVSLFAPRGVGDFAARPLALRAGGGSSLGTAFYSTVLDRVFDYVLMMLIIGPALLYATRLVSLEMGTVLAAILLGGGFFLVATRFGSVVRWLNTLLGKLLVWAKAVPLAGALLPEAKVERLRQLEDIEIDFRTAGIAYLLTFLYISMMILRSYFIGRALGVHLSFPLLLLSAPVAQLGQLLAFTPGALGIRELSWYGVLQAADLPPEDLLTFLVGHRAYIYACIVTLALISQLIFVIWPPRPAAVAATGGVKESKT
jgi:uncharacterized protein (TIRG00374 family)